ncbi:hypothetical protein Dimus_009655 [Dionaea muscipula]
MDKSLCFADHPKGESARAEAETAEEESGWTEYLEDFSAAAYNKHELKQLQGEEFQDGGGGCSSLVVDDASASLVSDAGTGPEWRNRILYAGDDDDHHHQQQQPPHVPIRKVNCINRRLGKELIAFDDPLEDTASSPVNSPKEEEDDDELKKKGLCLVPISTFINYVG